MKNKLLLMAATIGMLQSQLNAGPGDRVRSGDIFGIRCFVENRGQFNKKASEGDVIHFALENGTERIYFTNRGLYHELVKENRITRKERERIEKDPDAVLPPEGPMLAHVAMRWQGANSNITVERHEQQGHYLTYGPREMNSRTYKRLIYRN